MNSWDNPATKAVTLGKPDWLAVWGEQTKEHARIHLGMESEKVPIFGAAQFDVYRQPPLKTREAYMAELGISPDQNVILYAGSSKGVKEVQHLIALEEAIESGKLPRSHIIFRPHPWRGVVAGEVDFCSRKWKHVSLDPQMKDYYRASLTDAKMIYTPKIEYTHLILSVCDLLISPVSTILLEAAMHGKPILAYLPEEDIDKNFFLRTMANMNFMQEFFERLECGPVGKMDDLIRRTSELLKGSRESRSATVLEKTQYFVDQGEYTYLERLEKLLEQITVKV
jgi:CDP-glycerol glycerophosphotransferase (TagB/SpsB family)